MLPAVQGDAAVFAGVTYRPPDIVFDDHLRIDLGGRVVDIHWFGPANTPGDTITSVPAARVAWTGNVTGAPSASPWRATPRRFSGRSPASSGLSRSAR